MKPMRKIAETQDPAPFALRLADVAKHLCVSRSMAYVVIADPSFPKPKAIGPRLRVWMKDEIEEWLRSRPAGKPARLPHLHGGGPPKAA